MTIALPHTRPPNAVLVEPIVLHALREDMGRAGDITTDLIVPDDANVSARLVARNPGSISGLIAAYQAFHTLDKTIQFYCELADGSTTNSPAVLALVNGPARTILSAERVALNFVGHLSGIATATRALVDTVAGTKARIVCTRKTTPGLRLLEKYAVRCGGGFNHRFGLDDAILIKDNHIAIAGGIRPAIERVRAAASHMLRIEIEIDTLDQLEEALALGIDTILLDNMSVEDLRRARAITKDQAVLEASGNVTLETVRAIAETGVDYISAGAITHSARNLDVSLEF